MLSNLTGKLLGLLGRFRKRPTTQSGSEELRVGGLYSAIGDSDTGTFCIVKVLVLDSSIVHMCLYSNSFDDRPKNVDVSTLSIGGFSIEEDDLDDFNFSDLGIGHLPIELDDFINDYQPVFLEMSSVSDEDLEGYRLWREESGGTFGSS